MIFRAIVIYVAVQSAIVVASPTVGPHGESSVSTIGGTFYHPTPSSRARGIPEVGKLPRTSTNGKKIQVTSPTNRFTPGSHQLRNGRNPVIEAHQPLRSHSNHNHIIDDLHQKPRAPISHEERAEKVNSDLEKMIQFMTVLGQVDRYLSSRAKSIVSTLGRAMENIPDDNQVYSSDRESSFDY